MPEVFINDKVNSVIKELIDGGFQKSIWHSISALPSGVNFETQDDDEHVVLFLRAHVITNLHWIALILILFWIPLFWDSFPLISSLSGLVKLSIVVLWYLALAFFGFQSFLSWFYNVYIVTEERVVDVDFYGLLYKNVKTARIAKIEDVNYAQRGILSSFFDYGNVVVETASEQRSDDLKEGSGAFIFEAVPSPNEVVKVISELMEKEEEEHEFK